ncbi:tyrosine-type recombinase/integrase [Sphingomonas sp. NFR15]|uniref:tyrosine-type recombinase/integrase n=1 Tax=Sphingomonas sp. NFR15 TaxID=1566282 RepID=UPI00088F85AF|nr:tyrosine-type recombinase/integrase [Sphingomonas sp. NFR15]SDA15185.1 Site-specific recombinase XerD [Sphingomonas sp. NFR15]
MGNLRYTYVVKGRYWRFRRGTFNVPLPGSPGDPEFHEAYAGFLATTSNKPKEADRSSFTWLIKQYRASAEFKTLRPATQLDYGRTLDLLVEELGDQPYRFTTRAMIKALRDDHADTPRKAHKIKQMVSRLYSWADENDLVPEGMNPTEKLKKLKARSKSITPWSEPEIAMFLAKAPPYLVTATLLCLYTGQRAEDVVTMEWTQFQGDLIRVTTSKTNEMIDIACHPILRAHLKKVRTRFGGRIVRNAAGKPMTANAFAQALRGVVESIPEMPNGRSPHGLRYAAAGRMEEAGCTIVEASSVLGHRTYQMAMKYLSGRKASESALAKQENKG